MSNTNISQIGRDTLRLSYAGGAATLLFWAYVGDVGSGDGDNQLNQLAVPWSGRVRGAILYTGNDPGATTIGVHIDRNSTPLFSITTSPSGAGVATPVRIEGSFQAGQELSFSVNPTVDPGASYLAVAVQYDTPAI